MYILMSPLHVGAIFSVPTSSDRLRLAPPTPSLLPSLQLAPAHTSLHQLAPAHSQLTPAFSQWAMNSLVCIRVPTTSGGQWARGQGGSKLGASWSELEQAGSELSELNVILGFRVKFWSAHHLSRDKAPSLHSQVAPLTPKALSAVMAQWISRCTF